MDGALDAAAAFALFKAASPAFLAGGVLTLDLLGGGLEGVDADDALFEGEAESEEEEDFSGSPLQVEQ